jgi:RHS repeat-associated protein
MAAAPETYTYDGVSRLMSGTAGGAGNRQDYKYDLYGNRTSTTTTGSGCVNNTDCQEQPDVTIDPATNRITSNSAQYDTAGNLTSIDSLYTYSWDGAGMMTEQVASETHYQYVYDANDERIAIYTPSAKTWQFTLRDPAHNVIREVTATQSGSTWTWTWNRDHVYRGSHILATVTSNDTQHFHLDHLGTPRIVTNASGQIIGSHTYYPFGTELAPTTATESPVELHKFTGHERDALGGFAVAHTLDYMHARYYSGMLGRFLSIDSVGGNTRNPRSWNRYAYTLGNPLRFVDVTGMQCTQVTLSGVGSQLQCDDPKLPDGVADFFRREFFQFISGGANAYASDMLLGAGRVNSSDAFYELGQIGGDTSAMLQGFEEMLAGGTGDVGGSLADLVPGGQLVGVPVQVVSTGIAAHGGATTAVATWHLASGVKGLQEQVRLHEQKLADYKANPDAHDNKGFLKNATPDQRQKIIAARIRSLEAQIENFKRQIERLLTK